ncbi:MAG: glycosyltransferase family 4 protein, partial [Candidatus Omnitrophica bacterium]|nr:glycosyltransferase family 4 protein [Candidatus Omnitrophota bacterium]
YYPPRVIGGYELACREAAQGLRAKGHKVCVLTSASGEDININDDGVYRLLKLDSEWSKASLPVSLLKLWGRELADKNTLRRIVKSFKPDIVYVWNMAHLAVSLVSLLQRMGLPVSFYVFDDWLSKWENDPWFASLTQNPAGLLNRAFWHVFRFFARITGTFALSLPGELSSAQFASEYLKKLTFDSVKSIKSCDVIAWGIDVGKYHYKSPSLNPVRLLFVGQIAAHKGIATVIRALEILNKRSGNGFTLTIAGSFPVADYEGYIKELIVNLGLKDKVTITGQLSRESIISLYGQHDILIFPSVWDEPFGLVLLEAMASGLPVVATGTGGSSEIVRDGYNALIFPKEDAAACADRIQSLIKDKELFERIRANARRTVEEKFRLSLALDKIESSLKKLSENK